MCVFRIISIPKAHCSPSRPFILLEHILQHLLCALCSNVCARFQCFRLCLVLLAYIIPSVVRQKLIDKLHISHDYCKARKHSGKIKHDEFRGLHANLESLD